MTREEAIKIIRSECYVFNPFNFDSARMINTALDMAIKALEQEPKTGWNNHQIACMLADLFGDACACNYNGIDEWLSELCDFKDTCCPNPVGVACWEQFLKYTQSRYTECDYKVRDDNALKEPKTGHWILLDECSNSGYYCSECRKKVVKEGWSDTVKKIKYCPNCGAKMEVEE